jgi:hypothetical protein
MINYEINDSWIQERNPPKVFSNWTRQSGSTIYSTRSHSPTVVMLLAKIGQTYFVIVSLASFVNAAVASVLRDSSSGPDLALGVSVGGKYTASLFGNP